MIKSPVQLRSLCAGPFMVDDMHAVIGGTDADGFIRGKTVDDENLPYERKDVFQTAADMHLFVPGQDDGGEINHGENDFL